jgi:hypothetical protein
MISFLIPAHNEEAGLGRTLGAIHASAQTAGEPYEIIVVDDASTDATAEVARQHRALVLPVAYRQIAATRNAGARAARGERLVFVDADTTINARALAAALRCLDKGAAGGGASIWFEGPLPLYVRIFNPVSCVICKWIGFSGGAFLFCTREAFAKTGGFDERIFCTEDFFFIVKLKRVGRFIVLWAGVQTSGRRLRGLSGLQALATIARMVFSPFESLTSRSTAVKAWYDSNRSRDNVLPSSWGVQVSNAIVLVLVLAMLTGPVWNFIPWSATPFHSWGADLRIIDGTLLSLIGLSLWPISAALIWVLSRRQHWWEWLKTAALLAFCLWQAWGSTLGVLWAWQQIFQ